MKISTHKPASEHLRLKKLLGTAPKLEHSGNVPTVNRDGTLLKHIDSEGLDKLTLAMMRKASQFNIDPTTISEAIVWHQKKYADNRWVISIGVRGHNTDGKECFLGLTWRYKYRFFGIGRLRIIGRRDFILERAARRHHKGLQSMEAVGKITDAYFDHLNQ